MSLSLSLDVCQAINGTRAVSFIFVTFSTVWPEVHADAVYPRSYRMLEYLLRSHKNPSSSQLALSKLPSSHGPKSVSASLWLLENSLLYTGQHVDFHRLFWCPQTRSSLCWSLYCFSSKTLLTRTVHCTTASDSLRSITSLLQLGQLWFLQTTLWTLRLHFFCTKWASNRHRYWSLEFNHSCIDGFHWSSSDA